MGKEAFYSAKANATENFKLTLYLYLFTFLDTTKISLKNPKTHIMGHVSVTDL